MYHTIEDFIRDWKTEEEFTLRTFSMISAEAKATKLHVNVRSLDRLAWHLTQTISEMGMKAGLFDQDDLEHRGVPATIEEICSLYTKYSELLSEAVSSRWTDSELSDQVAMYGDEWSKGKILQVFILHQTHHRGQMTVIMRMLGLPIPGIYGPTKEEWLQFGLTPME